MIVIIVATITMIMMFVTIPVDFDWLRHTLRSQTLNGHRNACKQAVQCFRFKV